MKYFGGKSRVGKQLANLINRISGVQSYHETFCGLYSVGRHVSLPIRSGSDSHPDLIYLLNAVKQGWYGPTTLNEDEYQELKNSRPSKLRGFAGFGCSFGGKFFGGYARDKTGRNYCLNAHNSLKRLQPRILDVSFECSDYKTYEHYQDVVYLDPPYAGTTGFSQGDFDSEEFWDWAAELCESRIVLISEYKAPDKFIPIWEKPVRTDMNGKSGKIQRREKLFTSGLGTKTKFNS